MFKVKYLLRKWEGLRASQLINKNKKTEEWYKIILYIDIIPAQNKNTKVVEESLLLEMKFCLRNAITQ